MAGALAVTAADVTRITERLFLTLGDRRRNLTAFWVLLVLAGVIATAGVVADSTATVIGAMIVAPLMTPILGTALALVLADRRQLATNIALVVGAAIAVVLIGFVIGLTVQIDVVAATNSQVAGRVSPRLIDLLAAVATGMVGAFALVRPDVSDTLPGVAIAISLVPPLAVVGLTLESGAAGEAAGALLLFGTNVAAIIATGTVVMLAARIRHVAPEAGIRVGRLRGRSLVAVAASLVLVTVPLAAGSVHVLQEQRLVSQAKPVATSWAEAKGWQVSDVFLRGSSLHVVVIGTPPEPDGGELREAFDAEGLSDVEVELTLLVGGSETLDGA
ncbi:uncharacterized hydrophobic domain-containing protein [Nocardioides sp. YR527]|uniref:DUF389 domain-containing protein n=1 Tax=Nocardioides sp. YR527 TaxID=1881028 RepID=UPI00088BF9D4|nr:DUF389 domain-containing protein [Nocardioides sp. YR527]SDJ82785.1 uncharacterized hydrophobic domain-containing protein [Nocardioides sp. YR527]